MCVGCCCWYESLWLLLLLFLTPTPPTLPPTSSAHAAAFLLRLLLCHHLDSGACGKGEVCTVERTLLYVAKLAKHARARGRAQHNSNAKLRCRRCRSRSFRTKKRAAFAQCARIFSKCVYVYFTLSRRQQRLCCVGRGHRVILCVCVRLCVVDDDDDDDDIMAWHRLRRQRLQATMTATFVRSFVGLFVRYHQRNPPPPTTLWCCLCMYTIYRIYILEGDK